MGRRRIHQNNADRQRAYRQRQRQRYEKHTVTLPEPYYQDDLVTLYQGDCRHLLPLLAAASIDLVITDPPYEAEAHTQQRRVGDGRGVKVSPVAFDQIDDATRQVVADEAARLARRWVLIFCQVEAVAAWRAVVEAAGLVYKRACVWDKPDGMPQLSGDRPGQSYETFICAHQPGRTHWNGGGRRGVFRYGVDRQRLPHDTVKPLPLMRELIDLFSDPGDLVLDPFAGSGTTVLAARQLGRRAIGIELDQGYCDLIVQRLSSEMLLVA